jgi:hypothetical protein
MRLEFQHFRAIGDDSKMGKPLRGRLGVVLDSAPPLTVEKRFNPQPNDSTKEFHSDIGSALWDHICHSPECQPLPDFVEFLCRLVLTADHDHLGHLQVDSAFFFNELEKSLKRENWRTISLLRKHGIDEGNIRPPILKHLVDLLEVRGAPYIMVGPERLGEHLSIGLEIINYQNVHAEASSE